MAKIDGIKKAKDINGNVFTMFDKDWCLIAASKGDHYNMMTASWGGLGILWSRDVATIYVRPQRYTKEFIDESDTFTLSFFDEEYRKILGVLGSKSGRDMDKEHVEGLTGGVANGVVMFKEARLTLVCRKIYHDTIKPENFLDATIDKSYPIKDYHTMYIGEIVAVYEKE